MVTCDPEVLSKRNIFGNMAVQSWIDVLKFSKKTALLTDGEFFFMELDLFKNLSGCSVGECFFF